MNPINYICNFSEVSKNTSTVVLWSIRVIRRKISKLFSLAILTILILTVLIIGGVWEARGQKGLYISEICPHNDAIVHDSVGFYNDYIIISNSSDEPVNMEGYTLSDNKDGTYKYTFEGVLIEPQDNLLICAGEKKEFNDLFADDTAIYAGFRLSDK